MRKSVPKLNAVVAASVVIVAVVSAGLLIAPTKNDLYQKVLAPDAGIAAEDQENIVNRCTILTEPVVCKMVPLDAELQKKAQMYCGDYGVPYEIALSVMYQESRFDGAAQNGTCVGYMQVNSVNLPWLREEIGVTDLQDPEENVQAGIYMLGTFYEKYGEWNMALTAYNNGAAGAESKYFEDGKISCKYSENVLSHCSYWKNLLEESQ